MGIRDLDIWNPGLTRASGASSSTSGSLGKSNLPTGSRLSDIKDKTSPVRKKTSGFQNSPIVDASVAKLRKQVDPRVSPLVLKRLQRK